MTAMSVAGAYQDQQGFETNFGDPLEDSSNTLFELRLNRAESRIDVYQPKMDVRTSDPESKEEVEASLGEGYLDSLPLLLCPKPQQDLLVVDAGRLIAEGFYVARAASQRSTYRVVSAKAYKTSFDVTVEYIKPGLPTLAVGFSVVLLPEIPMVPRASDDRLLYFTTLYTDEGQHAVGPHTLPSQAVDPTASVIWRWNISRLENSTIRIHVDPSVPERWREWVREGVEAWNAAFALIGQPQAVTAVLPEDEGWPADYDMADARFSTISWSVRTEVASMGIAKVDPRSGEIIKGDITMSDGWVGAWLQDLDLLSPNVTHSAHELRAKKELEKTQMLQLSDFRRQRSQRKAPRPRRSSLSLLSELFGKKSMNAAELEAFVGAGLRSVVMHETGHILGLRHNFKGSLGVSAECLQTISCTAEQGLGVSVMDYLPLNMPSEGGPEIHVFSPVIGAYDKLAIRYGYIDMEAYSATELPGVLQEAAENFDICTDADYELAEDPFCAMEDLGEDPIQFHENQFEEFVRVQRSLLLTATTPGGSYKDYGYAVRRLLGQTLMLGEDLLPWLGGIRSRYLHRSLLGPAGTGTENRTQRAREPAPIDLQRRALLLLLRLLRPRSAGLLPPDESLPYLVDAGGNEGEVMSVDLPAKARNLTQILLSSALSSARVRQVLKQEQLLGLDPTAPPALSVSEFLSELVAGVLGQGFEASQEVPPEEMDLHMQLAVALKVLFQDQALPAEVRALVLQQLRQLSAATESGLLHIAAKDDLERKGRQKRASVDLMNSHLALLRSELSEVLCLSPEEICSSPRVPAQTKAPKARSASRSTSVAYALWAVGASIGLRL